MKTKLITIILVGLVGVLVITINQSSAHIENVLIIAIEPHEINFGTVFPQEYLEENIKIALSDSFINQEGVDSVEYKIIRKSKCKVWEGSECKEYYNNLCPFLSQLSDHTPDNDEDVPSYYDPQGCLDTTQSQALGYLNKTQGDYEDNWTIDLYVPPVAGSQPQNWPENCPTILEEGDYACDLSIEVKDINSGGITKIYNFLPIKIAQAYEAHIITVTVTVVENQPPEVIYIDSVFQYNLDDNYETVEGDGHLKATVTLSVEDLFVEGEFTLNGPWPTAIPDVYLVATNGENKELAKQVVDLGNFSYGQVSSNTFKFSGTILDVIKPINNGHYELLVLLTSPFYEGYYFFLNTTSQIDSHYLFSILSLNQPFTFVHMTDVHIGAEGEEWTAKERFAETLFQIGNMDPKPDFILITGDLVKYAPFSLWIGCWCREEGHYRGYLDALDSFAFDHPEIKIYPLPGNHDRYNPSYIQFVWGLCPYRKYVDPTRPNDTTLLTPIDSGTRDPLINYTFEHKGLLFLGLDSGWDYLTGELEPELELHFQGTGLYPDQMEALNDPTKVDPDVAKIIFMHHPVVDIDDGSVIRYNRPEFIEYCKDNEVQLVLTGHTHEDHIFDRDGDEIESWYPEEDYPLFIQTPSVAKDGNGTKFRHGYRVIDVIAGLAYPWTYTPTESYPMWKASLCSSGNLHAYDSLGRHTGLNVFGESEIDISHSFYFSPYVITDEDGSIIETSPEEIIVFDPCDNYLYEVEGTEEGTYELVINSVEEKETTSTFTATDIPTTASTTHQYIIDWEALSEGEEGVTLQIDADGDGVFEQSIAADSDLTYDEFILQTETIIDFDPDALNLEVKGKFVTAYIELPEGYEISQIDISNIMLNGLVPALSKPFEIGDYDNDGVSDLMVKFDRPEIQAILTSEEGVILTLTGKVFYNESYIDFEGFDTIKVIEPGN